jgi:hypothetical protein
MLDEGSCRCPGPQLDLEPQKAIETLIASFVSMVAADRSSSGLPTPPLPPHISTPHPHTLTLVSIFGLILQPARKEKDAPARLSPSGGGGGGSTHTTTGRTGTAARALAGGSCWGSRSSGRSGCRAPSRHKEEEASSCALPLIGHALRRATDLQQPIGRCLSDGRQGQMHWRRQAVARSRRTLCRVDWR